MAKIIKMSVISSKMSGKSAECVTMSERMANPLVRSKMSKKYPKCVAVGRYASGN